MRLVKFKIKWIVIDNWRLCTKFDNLDKIECVKKREQRQRNREQTWRPWQSEEPSLHQAPTFWPDFHPLEATGVDAFVLEWLWPLGSCLWFSVAAAQSASTSVLSTFSLLHGMAINITNKCRTTRSQIPIPASPYRHAQSSCEFPPINTWIGTWTEQNINIYMRTWSATWIKKIVDLHSYLVHSGGIWRWEEEENSCNLGDAEPSFAMKLQFKAKMAGNEECKEAWVYTRVKGTRKQCSSLKMWRASK